MVLEAWCSLAEDYPEEKQLNQFSSFQILGGLSGSEDRGGGDNSIQFVNFWRVDDKSFEE